MRKTIILAIATTFLAGASVVTGLARTFHSLSDTTTARSVVHPLVTGSLTASVVPSTCPSFGLPLPGAGPEFLN